MVIEDVAHAVEMFDGVFDGGGREFIIGGDNGGGNEVGM